MHPFCYKSIYATSTVKYRFNTDFKFHYCSSAFCVLKSAWHLCSNNYIAVLYKWLFIVRTLQFSIYYCITCIILYVCESVSTLDRYDICIITMDHLRYMVYSLVPQLRRWTYGVEKHRSPTSVRGVGTTPCAPKSHQRPTSVFEA